MKEPKLEDLPPYVTEKNLKCVIQWVKQGTDYTIKNETLTITYPDSTSTIKLDEVFHISKAKYKEKKWIIKTQKQ